jgi:glycosyltransferase involved in cell wall biosynthesis
MSKQPVLFISPQPFFEWRGSSIRVKFNVMALSELGYDVHLLTLPVGKDDPAITARVIRAWNIFGTRQVSIGPSLLKLWFDLILLLQGTYLVTRYRYRVLHGTEEAGFLSYLLSFICRARCIYEKHSDSGSYGGGVVKRMILGVYNQVEKLTIRRADLVICTGPGLEQQARAIGPTTTIRNIPDIPSSIVEPSKEEVKNVRTRLVTDENQVLITYVGSFAEYQGIDIIFDAIPEVISRTSRARFVIIGGDDEEISNYQKDLEQRGAGSQVCFMGKIDPDILPAYLAASDILLAPRKSGINSPLKILDYFKAGAAIVATDTIANQKLLNDTNAVLCPFDSGKFADTIVSLVDDPGRRIRLGENAYSLFQSTHNFSVFKGQLDEAYQGVLST